MSESTRRLAALKHERDALIRQLASEGVASPASDHRVLVLTTRFAEAKAAATLPPLPPKPTGDTLPPLPPKPKRPKRHLLRWLGIGVVAGVVGGAADGLVQLGELDAKVEK